MQVIKMDSDPEPGMDHKSTKSNVNGVNNHHNLSDTIRLRTTSFISHENWGSINLLNSDSQANKLESEDTTKIPLKPKAPDGGWGWVIVAASFCVCCTIGFLYMGFAVLYVSLVERFQTGRGVTGWIASFFAFSGNVLGVIIGAFVKQFGCKTVAWCGIVLSVTGLGLSSLLISVPYLMFTHGVMTGIGSSMLFISTLVILQDYFDKKCSIAIGTATAGISVGGFLSAPCINALLDKYGLSGTYIIISGIWMHNFIFTSFFRPLKTKVTIAASKQITDEKISLKENELQTVKIKNEKHFKVSRVNKLFKELIDVTPLKNAQLDIYLIGTILLNIGINGFYSHYLSRMIFLGIERNTAIIFQTATSVCTLISRITFSFVGNPSSVDRVLLYGLLITLPSLTLLALSFTRSAIPQAVLGCATTVLAGGSFAIQVPTLVDVAGIANITKSTGLFTMSIAIGVLVAVPLTGFIFDVSQNYDYPFIVLGALQLPGGVLVLCLAVLRRTKWKNREPQ